MGDLIIEKLIDNIKQSNNNKSSHWKLLLPKEKNLSDYQYLDYQIIVKLAFTSKSNKIFLTKEGTLISKY